MAKMPENADKPKDKWGKRFRGRIRWTALKREKRKLHERVAGKTDW